MVGGDVLLNNLARHHIRASVRMHVVVLTYQLVQWLVPAAQSAWIHILRPVGPRNYPSPLGVDVILDRWIFLRKRNAPFVVVVAVDTRLLHASDVFRAHSAPLRQ